MGIERPLGVSGILRCRNCADYLDVCIDSCIDALDELVAVYHDCDDNTPEILKFKQKQYPNKIKVYEYLPYILPIVPDKPMLQFAKNLPNNSQHLLSGYCNYALSKASYRYAIKIDADQIYFSQILKRFCDAYRSTEKVKFNALEYIAGGLHHAYIECFSHEKIHKFYLLEKISLLSFRYYRSYIEKRIIRDKIAVSLSGINLYRYDGQWKIGLGDKRVPEMYPPFNGVRDTFFFEVTAHTCFEKIINTTSDVNNQRISEIMYYHKEILDGGFCWFHVKPIMTAEKDKNKKIQMEYPDRFVALYELKKNPYRIFYKRYHPFIAVRFAEPAYSYFYTAMRKFIPWKLLGGIEQMYNSNMKNKNRIVMINPRDYYLEFHEELDKRLLKFTSDLAEEDVTRMLLGKHYIKEPLITFLFYQLTHEKERYNRCRLDGKSIDESMGRVDAFLAMFGEGVPEKKEEPITDICQHPWYEALSEYKNHIIIYLFNARQLQYLTPLINELDSPILLLSEYELPDETDLPDTVTALTIEFSSFRIFSNPYVEHCFPLIYHYTSFFSIMLRILQPTGIICLEGCHIEEQLLATVAQDYDIPTICIQQGWPSMMRTGFRRLSYRYFFTWGERFSKLWEKYNPQPQFTPMGYMYDVAHVEKENKKCVTFFLQSPCYLSDTSYFKNMLELITDSAGLYPEISFMVREHPDYKIDSTLIDKWKVYPNIQIATDLELQEVYRHTLVTVSHFSSALMEGVAHGCIPLVYDVTTNSRYYPDVEKEGLGKIAKTKDVFHQQLKEILSYSYDENPYLQNIRESQKQWFAATGDATLKQMAETFKTITHYKDVTSK